MNEIERAEQLVRTVDEQGVSGQLTDWKVGLSVAAVWALVSIAKSLKSLSKETWSK